MTLSAPIHAESGPTTAAAALREAETAFQSIDYDAVNLSARRGLTLGNATPAETARLHVLAGTSAAALGQGEDARRHFIAALAIQPNLELEQDLSPKLRDPYLEALGYWGSQSTKCLSLTFKCNERASRLSFQVADPAQLGHKLHVHVRNHGQRAYNERTVDSSERGHVDLPATVIRDGFDYFVTLVDGHDNRLVELGNEDEPLTVAAQASNLGVASKDARGPNAGRTSRGHSIWLPAALVASGVLVGGIGAYFTWRREDAAARWNGPGCESPGLSRVEQCGGVQSERARFEKAAIGSYVLGGALFATGASIWWLRSGSGVENSRANAKLPCDLNPLGLAVRCSGTF